LARAINGPDNGDVTAKRLTATALCVGTTLALAPSALATFPGKNGRIAFVHTERGGLREVYKMRADGSHQRHLANGYAPAFSPSGRKVLFKRRGSDYPSDYLYTIRANGTRLRRIPHTKRSFEGSFAPSGKRIVFSGWPHNQYGRFFLYTVRIDGSHRKRIPHSQNAGGPQFSPNGRWIVFGSGRGLGLIQPDGTHRRPLTALNGEPIADRSPDFSPGSRRIVFTRETPTKWGIYTIRKDGTHLRRVYEVLRTNGVIADPVFSPDGRKIAFSRRESSWDYRRVYSIRPDGSHLRRLSQGLGGHEQLSWGVRP
jgi:Tol biopolymer transport system component